MVFTTLIPTCRNDGAPVGDDELREILNGIATSFGGYTIEGIVEGCWIDTQDGARYQDRHLKVLVECSPDRLPDAEQVVRAIGRRLG